MKLQINCSSSSSPHILYSFLSHSSFVALLLQTAPLLLYWSWFFKGRQWPLLRFGYGLSPKGSCVGSLVLSVTVLRWWTL
jgi:hypothetical protein